MDHKDIDLTPLLLTKMSFRARTRGRYNGSELYGILHGYITPQTWLNPLPKKPEDAVKMWSGTVTHDHIQKLLKAGLSEQKREFRYQGITLVGKADYLPDDEDVIWEFKTSEELMPFAKPGHEFQGKLYCTLFERPRALILQPVQSRKGLFLKNIGVVERDDDWFKQQIEKLLIFHQRVEPLWEQQLHQQ